MGYRTAPPYSACTAGRFSETIIFMNLIHIAIEIRVPARVMMLDKAMRALFFQNGRIRLRFIFDRICLKAKAADCLAVYLADTN